MPRPNRRPAEKDPNALLGSVGYAGGMDTFDLAIAPDFQSFLDANMPMIHPEGTIGRVRRAFGINGSYAMAFKTLRHALRQEIDRWPEMIVMEIMQNRDLSERLDHEQMDTFRLLCQRHKQAILDAKFDADYFRTLEEFVLFFIYHDIRAVWVAGALKNVISESMARLYDRNDSSQRRILFTLLDFMALELSQVQRVYIRHAEYQEITASDPEGLRTRAT